jgi:hypothetical protein
VVFLDNKKLFYSLKSKITTRWPDIKIKHKQDYWFWRLVPKKRMYTSCVLGDTIWMGMENGLTLAHEAKHIEAMQRNGKFIFYLQYLYPQIIALLFLLGTIMLFYNSFILAGLVCLVPMGIFLFPFPSPTRAKLEIEALTTELAIEQWITGEISEYSKGRFINLLTSNLYYKMMWDKKEAEHIFHIQEIRITKAPKKYVRDSYINSILYEMIKGPIED